MGPGIDLPGKVGTVFEGSHIPLLQWGPGLISRESGMRALGVEHTDSLQWGPGLISRES